MVNVDVDVKDALLESQELNYAKNNIYRSLVELKMEIDVRTHH